MTWFAVELAGGSADGRRGGFGVDAPSLMRAASASGGRARADNPFGETVCLALSTSGGRAANAMTFRAESASGGRAAASVICRARSVSGGRAAGGLAAFANGFAARRRVRTVPQADLAAETLADFPFHVRGDASLGFLAHTSLGGRVTSLAGDDIRLETVAGAQLDHWLPSFAAAGPSGLRVRLAGYDPAAAQDLYVYYGKAGATGQQNPAGVFRGAAFVNTWAAGAFGADVSGKGRALTSVSGVAAGTIDGLPGGTFAPTSFARRTGPTDLDGVGAVTEEFWAQLAAAPSAGGNIARMGGTPGSTQPNARFSTFVNQAAAGGPYGLAVGWNPWNGTTRNNVQFQGSAQLAAGLHHFITTRQTAVQPAAYDGEAAVAGSAGTAQAGTLKSETGDVFEIGAGSGAQTVAVPMVLGMYTLWSRPLSPAFRAMLHRTQADAAATVAIGGEELPGDAAPSPVAMPVASDVVAGSTVDLDVVAAAYLPPGAAPPSLAATGAPAKGSASIAAGKLRIAIASGAAPGPDRCAFTLNSGARATSSIARLNVRRPAGGGGASLKVGWNAAFMKDFQPDDLISDYPAPLPDNLTTRTPAVTTAQELLNAVNNSPKNSRILLARGLSITENITLGRNLADGWIMLDGQPDLASKAFNASFAGDVTVTGNGMLLYGVKFPDKNTRTAYPPKGSTVNRLKATGIRRFRLSRSFVGQCAFYERAVSLDGARDELVMLDRNEFAGCYDHAVWAADGPGADEGDATADAELYLLWNFVHDLKVANDGGGGPEGGDASVGFYLGNNVGTNKYARVAKVIAFNLMKNNVGRACMELKSSRALILGNGSVNCPSWNLRGGRYHYLIANKGTSDLSLRGFHNHVIGNEQPSVSALAGGRGVDFHAGNYDPILDGDYLNKKDIVAGGTTWSARAVARETFVAGNTMAGKLAFGTTSAGDRTEEARPRPTNRADIRKHSYTGAGAATASGGSTWDDGSNSYQPGAGMPAGTTKPVAFAPTEDMVGPWGAVTAIP